MKYSPLPQTYTDSSLTVLRKEMPPKSKQQIKDTLFFSPSEQSRLAMHLNYPQCISAANRWCRNSTCQIRPTFPALYNLEFVQSAFGKDSKMGKKHTERAKLRCFPVMIHFFWKGRRIQVVTVSTISFLVYLFFILMK